jgi:hypothetical protein
MNRFARFKFFAAQTFEEEASGKQCARPLDEAE